MSATRPTFDRRIFWDVDYDKMDIDVKWRFVIERVFSWGDVEDVRMCRRYYGDDRVKEALMAASDLPFDSLFLVAAIIDVPVESIPAYSKWSLDDPTNARRTCMFIRALIHRN
jgi:hypothetical protein